MPILFAGSLAVQYETCTVLDAALAHCLISWTCVSCVVSLEAGSSFFAELFRLPTGPLPASVASGRFHRSSFGVSSFCPPVLSLPLPDQRDLSPGQRVVAPVSIALCRRWCESVVRLTPYISPARLLSVYLILAPVRSWFTVRL